MRLDKCVCASVPRVQTRIRWQVIRHATERVKPGNTGRLVAMALGCPLVDHGVGPDENSALDLQFDADAWLLFPDRPGSRPDGMPGQIIIVDGTWPQARRMTQRIPALFHLPRLALPTPAPRPRLRVSPRADGMSTLEAVASVIALFEGDEVARPLFALHDLTVERTRNSR